MKNLSRDQIIHLLFRHEYPKFSLPGQPALIEDQEEFLDGLDDIYSIRTETEYEFFRHVQTVFQRLKSLNKEELDYLLKNTIETAEKNHQLNQQTISNSKKYLHLWFSTKTISVKAAALIAMDRDPSMLEEFLARSSDLGLLAASQEFEKISQFLSESELEGASSGKIDTKDFSEWLESYNQSLYKKLTHASEPKVLKNAATRRSGRPQSHYPEATFLAVLMRIADSQDYEPLSDFLVSIAAEEFLKQYDTAGPNERKRLVKDLNAEENTLKGLVQNAKSFDIELDNILDISIDEFLYRVSDQYGATRTIQSHRAIILNEINKQYSNRFSA